MTIAATYRIRMLSSEDSESLLAQDRVTADGLGYGLPSLFRSLPDPYGYWALTASPAGASVGPSNPWAPASWALPSPATVPHAESAPRIAVPEVQPSSSRGAEAKIHDGFVVGGFSGTPPIQSAVAEPTEADRAAFWVNRNDTFVQTRVGGSIVPPESPMTLAPPHVLEDIIAWQGDRIDPMLHVRIGDLWALQGITDPASHPQLLENAQRIFDKAMTRKSYFPGYVAEWESTATALASAPAPAGRMPAEGAEISKPLTFTPTATDAAAPTGLQTLTTTDLLASPLTLPESDDPSALLAAVLHTPPVPVVELIHGLYSSGYDLNSDGTADLLLHHVCIHQ